MSSSSFFSFNCLLFVVDALSQEKAPPSKLMAPTLHLELWIEQDTSENQVGASGTLAKTDGIVDKKNIIMAHLKLMGFD